MTQVLISDFGGVLTTPIAEGFRRYQEKAGVTLEDLGRAMAAATEKHGEHPLYELERGKISEAEFGARLGEQLDSGFDFAELRQAYFERLEPNRRMIDYVAELRGRGLRAALLTNNVREWDPLWRSKLPEIDELFEVVVDSAFVGMRKPERGIYELTLDRLGGVEPGDCVFVDDFEVNCAAAEEMGMTAVRFADAEQAVADIEASLRN